MPTIPQQLAAVITSAKAKASDGLTVAEGIAIVKEAVATGMAILADLQKPGVEKKTLLLSYTAELVDFLLTKLVALLPFYARWAAPYFLPALKQAILAAADAWLEQVYVTRFKPVL